MKDDNRQKPNILVFFCDQLRIDLLSCYGGKQVRTPNIDSLAAESVVFDRAYTPCSLCSPARASLMTGVYPHTHHMFNNSTPGYSYCEHLRPDIDILPDWASASTNCETAYFGKWHIGPAEDLFNSSFDHTHPRPGGDDLPFLANSHWHPGPGLAPVAKAYAGGTAGTLQLPMDKFPDVAAANYTRRFINGERDKDRPFCAFCAFPGPHSPWFVPDEFGVRYNPEQIPLWPNRHDDMRGKPLNQIKLRLTGQARTTNREWNDMQLKELLACLFSYMELIDGQVGAVVSELKRAGLYENTAIVLTADHGDMAGAHGFNSKGSYMYDETYRIPMIVKTPGGSGHKRIATPVHLMDVTATLMHLMRGAPEDRMATHRLHGQSMLPLINGETVSLRDVHFAEYHGDWYGHYSARMVTDGKWKLVWNLTDIGELYDLENDPCELSNLFFDTSLKPVRDKYFNALLEEAKLTEDRHIAMMKPYVEDQCLARFRDGFLS